MFIIKDLKAREILDSRGRPTVEATCLLKSGGQATAAVPSGASTGAAEALELRDGDKKRYGGLGCRQAVTNVQGPLRTAVRGKMVNDQEQLDDLLLAADGTPNKSRLGANAILAVSLAFARACAVQKNVPLYRHFADLLGQPPATLPRLTINLFSGGKHAGGQVAIQDVLLAPLKPATIDEGLASVYAVYQAAAALAERKYRSRSLRADEGGLAPPFESTVIMIQDAVTAIEEAGLTPGVDMALAVDVAASHFHHDGRYVIDGQVLSSAGMIELLAHWVERFPIVSVEDGLAQDDWQNWPALKRALAGKALTLGDDLLCTNPQRIRRAAADNAADALLLKVNQIGSVSEALQANRLARQAGWQVTVSARSGETEDNWLADLAVGWRGDQIKIGSITQSERLAKYNRLLAIEADTGLPLASWTKTRSSVGGK